MPVRRAAQFQIRLPGSAAAGKPATHLPFRAIPSICPRAHTSSGPSIFVSPASRCATAPRNFSRASKTPVQKPSTSKLCPESRRNSPSTRQPSATLKTSSGEAVTDSGVVYVTGIQPGVDSSIDIVSSDGKSLRLVVLTSSEAEDAWKVRIAGSDHLLITAQDFAADPGSQSRAHLAAFSCPPAIPIRHHSTRNRSASG